eukprot:scaffold27736_cov78-Skeletonema_dohrnii-CCMP3373.AAC.1
MVLACRVARWLWVVAVRVALVEVGGLVVGGSIVWFEGWEHACVNHQACGSLYEKTSHQARFATKSRSIVHCSRALQITPQGCNIDTRLHST